MARNEADEIVTRNEQVVRRFIDAWAAKDVDACMACLSPEILYINQPLEPVVGLSNVRKIIKGILDLTIKVEWKLSNVFGRGNTYAPSGLIAGTSTARAGALGCPAWGCSTSMNRARSSAGETTSTTRPGSRTGAPACTCDAFD